MAAETELVHISTRVAGGQALPVASGRNEKVAVAAGSTTIISSTAGYLERLVVVPASTGAGGVTLSDSSVAILTIPAGSHGVDPRPYSVDLGIKCTGTGGFRLVLGASVSALAVGEGLSATTA